MECVATSKLDTYDYIDVNEDGEAITPYELFVYSDGRAVTRSSAPAYLDARSFAEMLRDAAATGYLERTRYGIDQGPRTTRERRHG